MKVLLAVLLLASPVLAEIPGEIDFNRDIRRILSDKCFHCHGPDAENQKSDFRLDSRESALQDYDGVIGIVPGKLKESELHWRIRAPKDDIDLMPPLKSNRVLSEREKDLLDAWIEQGANYDIHWAFKPPVRQAPGKARADWIRNPIDGFVAARLKKEGLAPTPEADLETLLRRAALTLTGLPPRPELTRAALAEVASLGVDEVYARFVEDLLASDGHAERQALRWLDAARFADTDGYQNDAGRTNWPWRDWVIAAFRENMPFDQFTIEQLAGDMLPEASPEQILASAFNRNHRQNSEGGALAPEFFVENVIDRVETTATVWLGLTMGCARCHDHKYDPLSQREFFQLFGYFNNIGEKGIGKGVQANPILQARSPLLEIPEALQTEIEEARRAEKEILAAFPKRRNAWIGKASKGLEKSEEVWKERAVVSAGVEDGEGRLDKGEDGSWRFNGKGVAQVSYRLKIAGGGRPVGVRLDCLPDPSFTKPRQLSRSVNGNFVLSEVAIALVEEASGKRTPLSVSRAAATFEQDKYPVANAIDGKGNTGWAVSGKNVGPELVSAYFLLRDPVEIGPGQHLELRLVHSSSFVDHNIGRLRVFLSEDPDTGLAILNKADKKITAALRKPSEQRSDAERKILDGYFRTIDRPQLEAAKAVKAAEAKLPKGSAKVPVMVMREREGERLPAYLLERGQYDAPDKSEELPRALPTALFEGQPEEHPTDRLGLARWLVSTGNPLTARVTVNRIWRDHFGIGLVKTAEDFGSQGELPSHPALLDWLALEFVESGWDLKALHRLIVTSATFRQGSQTGAALRERDPENRLLARGPRYRMDGFAIRDTALQAAGLLEERLGGPPVRPYQPTGLWNAVSGRSNIRYTSGSGSDLYRKSLYTYWKRAVNPPRQLIFDSGGREACTVAVQRTNTPLQALVLMNDPTFLEAARHLAERVLLEKHDDEAARLARIYKRATTLTARDSTLVVLRENLAFFREHFGARPEAADAFLKSGASPRDASLSPMEHAAWTAVAHLVLNLDTTISLQ